MPFRVGIDVGGTFTDAVAIDSEGGEKRWAKVPTTPPEFIEGVVESVRALGVDTFQRLRDGGPRDDDRHQCRR